MKSWYAEDEKFWVETGDVVKVVVGDCGLCDSEIEMDEFECVVDVDFEWCGWGWIRGPGLGW